MDVWGWKKNKVIASGWFYFYSSSFRGYVFANDDLVLREELVKKMSLNTLEAIRLYNADKLTYKKMLEALEVERNLNIINFVELGELHSLLRGVEALKVKKE